MYSASRCDELISHFCHFFGFAISTRSIHPRDDARGSGLNDVRLIKKFND